MDCSQIKIILTNLLNLRNQFAEVYSRVDESKDHHDPANRQAMESSESLMREIKKATEALENQLKKITFNQLSKWLKETKVKGQPLESKLEGGSLEALIKRQEIFYQKMYGKDFTIDRSRIRIDKSRLKAIAKGLETGTVNYPLIIATPETLTEEELAQTEAQFAYHKLLEPFKVQGLKIWAETGADDRWTKLSLEQVLEGYLPVELSDFDQTPNQAGQIPLEQDWAQEIQRIIKLKEVAPKIKPQQIKLIFTDSRQDVPTDQKPIIQSGEVLSNEDFKKIIDTRRFTEMIKAQVNVLNPQEWITLAAQLYVKDKTYLSRNTWDWLMAILKNKEGVKSPVSAANAHSHVAVLHLNSYKAGNSYSNGRWRLSL